MIPAKFCRWEVLDSTRRARSDTESPNVVPKDSATLQDISSPQDISSRAIQVPVTGPTERDPRPPAARTCWVNGLGRGDAVDAVFLLRRCDLRHTRGGAAYLSADLQDRTGTIAARLWLASAAFFGASPAAASETGSLLVERLRSAPFVHVTGSVKRAADNDSAERNVGETGRFSSGENDLHVELGAISPVTSGVDLRDLYEHTPADTDALLAELRTTFETEVEDAWVRRVLIAFLDDPALAAKLRTAPAASSFHHAYVGGLLEHIASLTRVTLEVCKIYPRLDRSLMIAGVFLHDVGKVDELSWERGLQYTDRGQLLGHIAIGVLLLDDKIRGIPGFPPRLRDVLQHLILSHHGTKEFGSPVLPVTPEAIAVHHLDNLDGKLWSAWRAQDDPRGDAAWSPHNRHLGRKIYRGHLDD
jgi:3'-5' exoribonuclease